MDNESYEQYELTAEQVGDTWKYIKEGMVCSMVLLQQQPDHRHAAEPRGLEDRILRAGRPRQHGHERDQALQGGNRRRVPVPRRSSTSAT